MKLYNLAISPLCPICKRVMWVDHPTINYLSGEVQVVCTMADCGNQNRVYVAKLPEIEVELSL